MCIECLLEEVAKSEGRPFEEVKQEFLEWEKEVDEHKKDGWNYSFDYPKKINSAGKSLPLIIELKDGTVLDGWYSSVCGYASSPSFYKEYLIPSLSSDKNVNTVEWWKYKDEKERT